MGMLDNLKKMLTGAVDKSGSQVGSGLDKAGDMVDDRTGGKHSGQIDTGVAKAKDALDGLDGKNDDIPPGTTTR